MGKRSPGFCLEPSPGGGLHAELPLSYPRGCPRARATTSSPRTRPTEACKRQEHSQQHSVRAPSRKPQAHAGGGRRSCGRCRGRGAMQGRSAPGSRRGCRVVTASAGLYLTTCGAKKPGEKEILCGPGVESSAPDHADLGAGSALEGAWGRLPGCSCDALFLGPHVGYTRVFKLHIYHLRFVRVSVCFYFCNIYGNEVLISTALLINPNRVVPEVDLFVGAGAFRDEGTQAPSGYSKSRGRSPRPGHKDAVTLGDLPPAREPCCGAIRERGRWCRRRPLGRGTLDGLW